ncbi:hypothetical protein AG1IA_00968 [Rhizoctonia solani AG-1 IA]|uniref:Uncharacterized protein n=1 Tax=Thanatephorus cucumeris (strain AG1-IA) TaxID=983506 RepID=L8X7H9_THACA|nr:hypothetical protein AG1IA_00968 [Rhizoctonia solani AG-1 IA]
MSESVDCAVPRLQEYCCKVQGQKTGTVGVVSPGMLITPTPDDPIVPITNLYWPFAQHLVNDTQGEFIWRKRCLDEFLEFRQANENGTMLEPESWREQYFVRLGLTSRLRGMYQKEEAGKRVRQTMYTTKAPPPKRGRWGKDRTSRSPWPDSEGISKPRTLIDKARQDTRRIQHVHVRNAGSSDQPIVQRKVVPLGTSDLIRPRPTQSTTLPKPPVDPPSSLRSPPSAGFPCTSRAGGASRSTFLHTHTRVLHTPTVKGAVGACPSLSLIYLMPPPLLPLPRSRCCEIRPDGHLYGKSNACGGKAYLNPVPQVPMGRGERKGYTMRPSPMQR